MVDIRCYHDDALVAYANMIAIEMDTVYYDQGNLHEQYHMLLHAQFTAIKDELARRHGLAGALDLITPPESY